MALDVNKLEMISELTSEIVRLEKEIKAIRESDDHVKIVVGGGFTVNYTNELALKVQENLIGLLSNEQDRISEQLTEYGVKTPTLPSVNAPESKLETCVVYTMAEVVEDTVMGQAFQRWINSDSENVFVQGTLSEQRDKLRRYQNRVWNHCGPIYGISKGSIVMAELSFVNNSKALEEV